MVACVGVAVLDLIYGVERLPSEDSKIRAHSLVESGGGMAANAASAIVRLGGQATWYGRVGDDEMGTHVLAGLRAEGVETAAARRIADARTSHSVILVDGEGDRAIVLYGSEALDGDPSWLPLDQVAAHQVVLADIRWIPGAISALTAARASGRPAVLDADTTYDPTAMAAVKAASHVVFSKPGLECLFGGAPEEGLRRAADHAPFVAVTLGSQGVLWIDASGGIRRMPAVPVETRETLGAGDVFHGAFALALAEGRTEEQAIEFGAVAAALKCGRAGGRSSFPYRNEVDEWMRRIG
ncbi:MAG TPA: PfkB family carbohydrate kinase [Dongiaceae bacterium]|nr:PfkB family carbohydrate kinase [Dongiaceae bacterium]